MTGIHNLVLNGDNVSKSVFIGSSIAESDTDSNATASTIRSNPIAIDLIRLKDEFDRGLMGMSLSITNSTRTGFIFDLVHGYKQQDYICAQVPASAQMTNAFWRMIWTQKVFTIAVLTPKIVAGLEYWPSQKNQTCDYETVSVTNKSIDEFEEYSFIILLVTSKQVYIVTLN